MDLDAEHELQLTCDGSVGLITSRESHIGYQQTTIQAKNAPTKNYDTRVYIVYCGMYSLLANNSRSLENQSESLENHLKITSDPS